MSRGLVCRFGLRCVRHDRFESDEFDHWSSGARDLIYPEYIVKLSFQLIVVLLVCLAPLHSVSAEWITARYFNTSGSDGCDPGNIGHRLGGDLEAYEDNTLSGMVGVERMQASRCFKAWETDLHQGTDAVLLSHDPVYRGYQVNRLRADDLPEGLVTLSEFTEAFLRLDLTRPLILDIKDVSNHVLWEQLRNAARTIESEGGIPVWFLISDAAADAHQGLCDFLNGEFEILLYGRKGSLCDF